MESSTRDPASEASPTAQSRTPTEEKHGPVAPVSANSKSAKRTGTKETGLSLRNSINKSMSQIRKHPLRRSGSPITWFPRKKADSFLQRKIKHLQDAGGMNLSLDETLGGANLHYSKIAREKIAVTQAANRAMEARKAAMVEASWCRILKAARIQNKEAEAELEKAEKRVSEAFEAAVAMGVMMYDKPGCQRWPYEVETSLSNGGKSTHTVTASFETAFEVDKEVAAAIKKAFIRLANCPSSSNKEEFKGILHKISENPDNDETCLEFSKIEIPSNCESELCLSGSHCKGESKWSDMKLKDRIHSSESKNFRAFTELVDIMFDRLKCLQEDELSSLATIVATCGLSAALLEKEHARIQDTESSSAVFHPLVTLNKSLTSMGTSSRRYSIRGLMEGHLKRKENRAEVVSLDKFLVKHLTRLEREVQEARNSKKDNSDSEISTLLKSSKAQISHGSLTHSGTVSESTPGLGSILLKHASSLESDIQAAKATEKNNTKSACQDEMEHSDGGVPKPEQLSGTLIETQVEDSHDESSDDKKQGKSAYVQIDKKTHHLDAELRKEGSRSCSEEKKLDKENVDLNMKSIGQKDGTPTLPEKEKWIEAHPSDNPLAVRKHISRIERAKQEVLESFSIQDEQIGLDRILVKPVNRLDRIKKQVVDQNWDVTKKGDRRNQESNMTASESLDKVLVKHVSRLEKEKLAALQEKKEVMVPVRKTVQHFENNSESLDAILVKHQPGLEKAKLAPVPQSDYMIKHTGTRREAREKEMHEAWGGLSLGNSLKPSLSKLEREKAAWRKAEEEERRPAMEL